MSQTIPLQLGLGKNVRARRLEKALTQEELADIAQLDRSYIGQVERGERNVSLANLHRIAQALNISIAELTEGI